MTTQTKTARPPDWPQRLAVFLASKERAPFCWGKQDCCQFVAAWLCELTGKDLAEPFRGYTSALGAARVLKANGGILALADNAFAARGWPVVPVALARRGDVVACNTPHGPALGICHGTDSAFAGKTGIILHPTLASVRAWRVL